MASTRDKRLKTDSPTPVQPAEPVVITPTSKAASTAIKLKRMSRNRSGILSVKTENEDGNDSVGLSEDTQSSTASVDAANLPKTPNTRTKRQKEEVKDEKEEESEDVKEGIDDADKDPDTPRTRKLTKAQMLKKKGAELALARHKALLKRGNLHSSVKSSSRFISGRLSGSTKTGENVKEEKTAVKKGKPGRKPAAEKKEAEVQQATEEEAENVPEAEVETEKPSEVLEKSDVTEKSEEVNDSQSLETSIKQEKNTSISAIDLQNVRRSTRARKSTIKDRDSPFTGRRSQARDKSEQKRDSISPALSSTSIKAEKENSKAISITVEQTEVTEKDVSLSPELVSEEMDTESVQNLYDKPDFLENNLGIEQDPKLGEIVKVQEKTKVVEPVIKNEDEPLPAEDIEMKEAEEKKESKKEKVNGDKEVEKAVEEEPEVKTESDEEKVEESAEKDEESGEENKENNESSARSVGSGSPRAEISLKIVSEENVPKMDPVESELLKEKETHLFAFGLMTHKAAAEAKKAKIKRQEELSKAIASQPTTGRKSKKDSASNEQQYTGTLKTIIKLNRTEKEKRKTRMPLKMTFQKKNRDRDSNGSSNSSDSFYTIQEKEANSLESHGAISRKSHNRSYNHDQVAPSNEQNQTHEPVVNKELDQSLVIPEKASSFKVHPERLCKDQCFYCGGKFGLYDTPCHIAQIKSTDRQKKILDSEEKLTKDSCLCDACFRHVDRRPSRDYSASSSSPSVAVVPQCFRSDVAYRSIPCLSSAESTSFARESD